jgi:hypothetical protein
MGLEQQPKVIINEGRPSADQTGQPGQGTPGAKNSFRSEKRTMRMGVLFAQPQPLPQSQPLPQPQLQNPVLGQTGPVNAPEMEPAPFSMPALPFRAPDHSNVLPGQISRETSRKLIDGLFESHGQTEETTLPQPSVLPAAHPFVQPAAQQPRQSAMPFAAQPAAQAVIQPLTQPSVQPAVSVQPSPQPAAQQSAPVLHSGFWQNWANYYGKFPIAASTVNDVEPHLIKPLDLALSRLKLAKPPHIEQSINIFRQGGQAFEAIAPHIETIRQFGCWIYSRLTILTRAEEDKVYIRSESGQKVLREHPDFARPYEVAPNELEIAKKDYRNKLRNATALHVTCMANENPPQSPRFSPAKVGEFIFEKTWTKISEAVKELKLPAQQEAALYQLLPVEIIPAGCFENSGNTQAYFRTAQPLPYVPAPNQPAQSPADAFTAHAPTDFRNLITRALLRAKVLQLAAYGDNDQNREYLWHYAHSMKPGTLAYGNESNPGFMLQYNLQSRVLDNRNFFQPVFSEDPQFFGDLLVLGENNAKTEGVNLMVKWSMEEATGEKNTMVGVGDISVVSQDKANAREFLQGPETQEETARVTNINSTVEGVETLNIQRARSIRVIGQLMEENDLKEKKIMTIRQQVSNASAQTMQEQNRAAAFEKSTEQWRLTHIRTLHDLLAQTSWYDRKLRKTIKAELAKMGIEVE